MTFRSARFLLLLATPWFFPVLAWAAPFGEGATPGESGLPAGPGSSQDQFQRYQQRQQQLDMLPPPDSNTQFITAPHTRTPSRTCVPITSVAIENAPHLPIIELRTVMARYSGRCLLVADLNHALDDINGAYLAQGHVTSRAYLPEQSLRDGTLRIVVVEGGLDGFAFSGVRPRWHETAAFPGLKGHILNLRDLEQGLDQMNRLPSWSARMQIVPGRRPGTSSVKITQSSPGILHGQVWADDNGQYETGHETGHAQLRADDPLGMLDMWSFEYDHSLVGDAGRRGTQYISANGAIPYGPWTLSGGWWMSNDVYHIETLNQDYRLAGRRKDFRIGLSRVVARNRVGVTTLQAGYELKSFLSTLDRTRLYTQSARQASVSAQGTESLKAWGGIWYITVGIQFYVGGVGTYSSITYPGAGDPHTRYMKPTLDIDGYKPLPGSVLWHTSLHGEYSTRDQFSTQQLQVGGPYTVRGFLSQMLLGNDGLYMRNDFSWMLAHPGTANHCGTYTGFCRVFVEGTEFYAIFDVGMTRAGYHSTTLPPALRGGNIAGSGIGLRKSSGVVFWDASATHAIARGPLPAEGWIAAFRAGVRF
ncbi:ShlB/FhaC/HecB family hemolysin secretion/activation protein [Gluconacetobacter asukensis]|uniref:ShlB/FhaC/HecB family hemolysin secretion/activation protein n=2 Tax=Gluconacetobacter asukensis TaxID=1017181 RepID=A0A7W4J3P7_9PROT|nr:ShlB/FhaC/HecB family hemolysin secretion/activation protein [Gluconacetobacter asukensis]MBB2174106.1 ShlB/FhaC/HecB family hemolysin secretion/activation protein [Gluconacetobacter asukensis]